MKNISIFFSALIALLFSVAETNAQITPPYYNPANVRITGGTINGTTVGATTAAAGAFTTLAAGNTAITGTLSTTGLASFGTTNKLYALESGATNYFTTASNGVGQGVFANATQAGLIVAGSGVATATATGLAVTGTLSATGTANTKILTAAATSGGNQFYIKPQAAGSGVEVFARNSADSAYEPVANYAETHKWHYNAGTLGMTLDVSGDLSLASTTDATSTTAASLKTAGGLGVAKKAYFGDAINVNSGAANVISTFTNNNAKPLYVLNDVSGTGFSSASTFTNSFVYLTTTGAQIYASGLVSINGDIYLNKTITTPGTTGARTINKTTGRVNFAAAATSLVVTNSLATANSICHVTKATNDATMRLGACVAAAGSITIYADVAPAAETAVNFTVTN